MTFEARRNESPRGVVFWQLVDADDEQVVAELGCHPEAEALANEMVKRWDNWDKYKADADRLAERLKNAQAELVYLRTASDKYKADADRLAEALKRIAGQFECHACSDCTDIARAALAAHEDLGGRA